MILVERGIAFAVGIDEENVGLAVAVVIKDAGAAAEEIRYGRDVGWRGGGIGIRVRVCVSHLDPPRNRSIVRRPVLRRGFFAAGCAGNPESAVTFDELHGDGWRARARARDCISSASEYFPCSP